MASNIKVGDLVQFDSAHIIGIVLEKRYNAAFPDEKIEEIYVHWIDGTSFWCLEFTLIKL